MPVENPLEARILTLERLAGDLYHRLLAAERRMAGEEQQLAQLWSATGGAQAGVDMIQPAVLTGSLAGGSLGSPALASATLYTEAGGSWTAGTSITVRNTYSLATALASGKQVWVVNVNGNWYLLTANC